MIQSYNIKRAAAFKMNRMVENAVEIALKKEQQSVVITYFGQGLMNFGKDNRLEWSFGLIDTIKALYSGEIFHQEGVWLSARLVASNIGQFVVVVLLLIQGYGYASIIDSKYPFEPVDNFASDYVQDLFDKYVNAQEFRKLILAASNQVPPSLTNLTLFACQDKYPSLVDLGDSDCDDTGDYFSCLLNSTDEYICSVAQSYADAAQNISQADTDDVLSNFTAGMINIGLLKTSGLDVDALYKVWFDNLQIQKKESIKSLYPSEKEMVLTPVIVGSVVAVMTAISLAVTYIPSVTSTIFKLRTGVIPSLRDVEFHRYRNKADEVTIITGSLFFGCLYSSMFLGLGVGLCVFFFMWDQTTPIAIYGFSAAVGMLVVVLIKTLPVICCRNAFYKGFYRKNPPAVNFVNLALECANFAISAGFVVIRMVKLLVTAALYVGRIDTPFLAKGVGQVGAMRLDNYPDVFLKDILSHEAHRHPYIDLLGVIYLMKLQYGDNFGNRAGSTWRLVFVYALMPWMQKYRILVPLEQQTFVSKEKTTNKKDQQLDEENQEESKERKSLMDSGNLKSRAVMRESTKVAALRAENAALKEELISLRKDLGVEIVVTSPTGRSIPDPGSEGIRAPIRLGH